MRELSGDIPSKECCNAFLERWYVVEDRIPMIMVNMQVLPCVTLFWIIATKVNSFNPMKDMIFLLPFYRQKTQEARNSCSMWKILNCISIKIWTQAGNHTGKDFLINEKILPHNTHFNIVIPTVLIYNAFNLSHIVKMEQRKFSFPEKTTEIYLSKIAPYAVSTT